MESLLNLRHVPGLVALTTAAIACTSAGRWSNLRSLIVDPTVRSRYDQRPLSLIDATSPYRPFGSTELTAHALARAATEGKDLTTALGDFTQRNNGKYHTPVAEWLHSLLRPIFLDQLPDDDGYASEFDRAEVMVGLLAYDSANVRREANPDGYVRAEYWFGRSTWRAQHSHGNPLADFAHELATQGDLWGPLQGNLFGGASARATSAIESYAEDFNRISRNRF